MSAIQSAVCECVGILSIHRLVPRVDDMAGAATPAISDELLPADPAPWKATANPPLAAPRYVRAILPLEGAILGPILNGGAARPMGRHERPLVAGNARSASPTSPLRYVAS